MFTDTPISSQHLLPRDLAPTLYNMLHSAVTVSLFNTTLQHYTAILRQPLN